MIKEFNITVDQAKWREEVEKKLNELIRDHNKRVGSNATR